MSPVILSLQGCSGITMHLMQFHSQKSRAFNIHSAAWCGVLLVLALFVWLNVDRTRDAYVLQLGDRWHGGLREGFPMIWWDAGIETWVKETSTGVSLQSRNYGGFQWVGVVVDFGVFAATAAAAVVVIERIIRALLSNQNAPCVPVARAGPMRPISGVAAVAVLAISLALNFSVSIYADDSVRRGFSQSMGWPFTTYSASIPATDEFAVPITSHRTTEETLLYLEEHPNLVWRIAHWHTTGIVLDIGVIMVLVFGAAFFSEKLMRPAVAQNSPA